MSQDSAAAPQDEPFAALDLRVDGAVHRYRLLRPARLEPGKRYPLVLFLHGAGERGDDNAKQLAYLPQLMAKPAHRKLFPCFLLAPQCRAGARWVEVDWAAKASASLAEPGALMRAVLAILARTLSEEAVDRDRIYLTGLSMGGYGAWDLAARHPELFAAAAPICGGGDERSARRLVGLPLWAWHGDADRAVPVERSRAMIAALRRAGGQPRYSELAGVGHASWIPAYGDPDGLLAWMFAQRRAAGLAELTGAFSPLRAGDRLVFLGDSITAAGVRKGGYVQLIAKAVSESLPDLEVAVVGAGISGNKVPDLLARLERDVLSKKPTAVFIYIGINDVWHGLQGRGTPAEEYRDGLRELLARIAASGATIVLATPSVIGEKSDGSNPLDGQLEEYAAISRAVAAERGVYLCDLRRAFLAQLCAENGAGRESGVLTSDGVHLNAAGNRLVAGEAARALAHALRRRPPVREDGR